MLGRFPGSEPQPPHLPSLRQWYFAEDSVSTVAGPRRFRPASLIEQCCPTNAPLKGALSQNRAEHASQNQGCQDGGRTCPEVMSRLLTLVSVAEHSPMPRPWKLIERVDTPEGPLELRQRDARDFMISIAGRVLMSSVIHRSESLIAELGCAHAKGLNAPRVLIGGLGLGFTLRAALDALPKSARVTVAELNPVVVAWGRGPLLELTASAIVDPRVEVVVGDVAEVVRHAAPGQREKFDAIIVDLYLGPSQGSTSRSGPAVWTQHLEGNSTSPEGPRAITRCGRRS